MELRETGWCDWPSRIRQQNQPLAAARAYRLLLDRFPDHPLSDAAAIWLWEYYGSLEWQWIQEPDSRELFIQASADSGSLRPDVTFEQAVQRWEPRKKRP
ncbi:MAG: hypothetical protein R3B96_21760 [Pirellulaceae bacterium]